MDLLMRRRALMGGNILPEIAIAYNDAPIFVTAMYTNGLCSNNKYITVEEAASITQEQFDSIGVIYSQQDNISNEDLSGFSYFTSLTKINKDCPIKSTTTKVDKIVLPNTITSIVTDNLKTKYLYVPVSVVFSAFGFNSKFSCGITKLELAEGYKTLPAFALQGVSIINCVLPSTITTTNDDALKMLSCNTLLIKAIQPPSKLGSAVNGLKSTCSIYVPDSSVDTYKEVLSGRVDYIYPISDYTE